MTVDTWAIGEGKIAVRLSFCYSSSKSPDMSTGMGSICQANSIKIEISTSELGILTTKVSGLEN